MERLGKLQLVSVSVGLGGAGKTVVAGEHCDSAQWAVVQNRKAEEVVDVMYKEIDLTARLVGLRTVEKMIGKRLLGVDPTVVVLAVSGDLVVQAKRHLGDPFQEASPELGAVLLVDSDCVYRFHHPVSLESNLHLRLFGPRVTAQAATLQLRMS